MYISEHMFALLSDRSDLRIPPSGAATFRLGKDEPIGDVDPSHHFSDVYE
jgi:hypothetical protein